MNYCYNPLSCTEIFLLPDNSGSVYGGGFTRFAIKRRQSVAISSQVTISPELAFTNCNRNTPSGRSFSTTNSSIKARRRVV